MSLLLLVPHPAGIQDHNGAVPLAAGHPKAADWFGRTKHAPPNGKVLSRARCGGE